MNQTVRAEVRLKRRDVAARAEFQTTALVVHPDTSSVGNVMEGPSPLPSPSFEVAAGLESPLVGLPMGNACVHARADKEACCKTGSKWGGQRVRATDSGGCERGGGSGEAKQPLKFEAEQLVRTQELFGLGGKGARKGDPSTSKEAGEELGEMGLRGGLPARIGEQVEGQG